MSKLTQAELNRLAACVIHDLQDYGEDEHLSLEYEIASNAIKKVAEVFGLDAREALTHEESDERWPDDFH